MKRLSFERLADAVKRGRKAKGLTQVALAKVTGINRSMIGQLENLTFKPSIEQLEALAEALDFEITDLYVDEAAACAQSVRSKSYKIAIAYRLCWPVHCDSAEPAQPRYRGRHHS